MKRSEMQMIILRALAELDVMYPDGYGYEEQAEHVLKAVEAAGMRRVDESDDYAYVLPWEPEEGWDAYAEAQDRIGEARDFQVVPRINQYTGERYITRSQPIAELFLQGKSFEEIASLYNVTRERVRQCVAKERRRYQIQLERKK